MANVKETRYKWTKMSINRIKRKKSLRSCEENK